MAFPCPFLAEDAKESIKRTARYTIQDSVVGAWVEEFIKAEFPIKSPHGFDFLARNSSAREDVRDVLESMLDQPHWGLVKVYSDVLPPDYVYRLHNGPTEDATEAQKQMHTILIQLWSPNTILFFYKGSEKLYISGDKKMNKTWGLVTTPKKNMNREGISEEVIKMKLGGLVLVDSRLGFTPLSGLSINIGFTTKKELGHWAKMGLPYSELFKTKIEELERRGLPINYIWIDPVTTQSTAADQGSVQ